MSNIIRIKRRLDDGSVSAVSGAPASLYNAEMAFNEVDNTLYYGRGDNGSGVATQVVAIGGKGYIDTLVSNTSASLLTTINENLSTVLGADISALSANLNSINELANSLSGDAQFAVTVNDRLNFLDGSSGNLTPRVGALEANFVALTGASQVTVLGTIADQDKNAVDITGGTITGITELTVNGTASVSETLTVTGLATLNGGLTVASGTTQVGILNASGAVDFDSTLNVDGKATLESLEVTNDADFKSDVRVDGTFEVGSGSATLFVEAGKVGINTETPSEALDVVGNGKFSGDLMGTSGTSKITGFEMDGGSF